METSASLQAADGRRRRLRRRRSSAWSPPAISRCWSSASCPTPVHRSTSTRRSTASARSGRRSSPISSTRRSPGGLALSINDGGAAPETVALRLAQAVRLIEETADEAAGVRHELAELVRGRRANASPAARRRQLRRVIGPEQREISPHLARSTCPGVRRRHGRRPRPLDGTAVFVAAQEGRFMGGAFGEVHGAKLTVCCALRATPGERRADPVRYRRRAPAGGQCRRARDRRDHARDDRGAARPASR